VAHPGKYGTFRRLQRRATSALVTEPTTKFAPRLMYRPAVIGSSTEPMPKITDGSAFSKCTISSRKTSKARSPRLVNSMTLQPPAESAATIFLEISTSPW